MLTEKIYYADKEILEIIDKEFVFIEKKPWYLLYQNNSDKSFWRLDEWDKYQEQFFVKLNSTENWQNFDAKELQIELLRNTKGVSDNICIWNNCNRLALQGLAYCERHAYEEMGIRR
jgi:hypothetical protein